MTYLALGAAAAFAVAVYLFIKIRRDTLLGVCLFVFLSSITMMPNLPVVGDRLAVADFVMLITLLTAALSGSLYRRVPAGLKLVDELATLFIVLVIIFSLAAASIRGSDPVRALMFLVIYTYGYMCFRLILRVVNDRASLERVMKWYLAGAVVVIVIGFLAATGIYRPAWTFDPEINRISSTFKYAGQMASYMGPAMFLLYYLAVSPRISRGKQFAIIGLILAGNYVLLGAGSRTSFAVMVLSTMMGLWIIMTSRERRIRRGPILLICGLGAVAFVSFALAIWTDQTTSYSLVETSPFERAVKMWSEQLQGGANLETLGGTRYDEISIVLANFDDSMFLGVGSGMFSSTFKSNEVHNTYFSILAENGVIAFIIFGVWWALMGAVQFKSIATVTGEGRTIARLAFCAFVILSLYQMTINGMRQRPFWFIPALSISAAMIVRKPQSCERNMAAGKATGVTT